MIGVCAACDEVFTSFCNRPGRRYCSKRCQKWAKSRRVKERQALGLRLVSWLLRKHPDWLAGFIVSMDEDKKVRTTWTYTVTTDTTTEEDYTMNINLKGVELANHLAANLTDLEFELLVRERIKLLFAATTQAHPNLSESHNTCRFSMSWSDNSAWYVQIGENYNKFAEIKGQVLTRCVQDVQTLYAMNHANKLSLLLPTPVPVVEEDTEDKKW